MELPISSTVFSPTSTSSPIVTGPISIMPASAR
jgi:hypothetical protein